MLTTPRKKLSLLIHACIVSSFTLPLGAYAQQNDDGQTIEEIQVTGSRISRRDGYSSPTPLTVVTGEALRDSADTSILTHLLTMPAVSGARTTSAQSGLFGQGMAGVEVMNLRSMGQNRTLVLLDGARVTPAHYLGYTDIGAIPSNLISRVDIVTGGASAVYGSDAVAGVVNFVLNKDFTGFKTEISSGFNSSGDDKNEKVTLTAGFPFANERGHVLLSGETYNTDGIDGDGGRGWNSTGWILSPNPGSTPTNGLPQFRFAPNTAIATASAGGLIVGGPLKGTAFGHGGTPYQFGYGETAGAFMTGGDWQENNIRTLNDMKPGQSSQNVFSRASYDLADNFTVYGQWSWASTKIDGTFTPMILLGTSTGYVVQRDNAFLPASIGTAMDANNISSFPIGSWNQDMGLMDNLSRRITSEAVLGANGMFELADKEWEWNVRYTSGATDLSLRNTSVVLDRYRQTIDAVVDPANGQVVCRSVLQGASNGCRPWNPFGIGVNDGNEAAHKWMVGNDGFATQDGTVELESYSATITGDPFSLWAGPVSMALSAEQRTDSSDVVVDGFSATSKRPLGNYSALNGESSVKEAAIEVIVPLAVDQSWARSLDLSLAVRGTDYEHSGQVTTWKVGSTYAINDSIKLRATLSRDIRAPNLFELFSPGQAGCGSSVIFDQFRGEQAPQALCVLTSGNPDLTPEIGKTLGLGFVITPTIVPELTVSVDYWRIEMEDAIESISSQQVVNSCFDQSQAANCKNIIRNPNTGTIDRILNNPINLSSKEVEGIDAEASYSLSENLSLHGNVSFYLKDYQDTVFVAPTDSVGQNSGFGVPDWKANITGTYSSGPLSGSLTVRAVSKGTILNSYIECTSGCPAPTTTNQTINNNEIAGRVYMDSNLSYQFGIGNSEGEVFVAVRNMLDRDPPPISSTYSYYMGLFSSNYDFFGRTFRVGVRFSL